MAPTPCDALSESAAAARADRALARSDAASAIPCLERAVALNPGSHTRWTLLARAYALLSLCSVAMPAALCVHVVGNRGGVAALIAACTLVTLANKLWWTAQGALFNDVAIATSTSLRASHLTLLNALSNVGKFWPKPLAMVAADGVGFAGSSALCAVAGVAAWPIIAAALARLSIGKECVEAMYPAPG